MLNIKSIVYLAGDKFDELEKEFNCHHIEASEPKKPTLDMDALSDLVQSLIKDKTKAPVFLFCATGYLSGALAAKVTMDTNKTFVKELAITYLMQKRYELKEI